MLVQSPAFNVETFVKTLIPSFEFSCEMLTRTSNLETFLLTVLDPCNLMHSKLHLTRTIQFLGF